MSNVFQGLDPAMPLFTDPNNGRKLDSSDAKFVQIIHTDALEKGKFEATGHVDFYVNGGMEQKGCPRDNMSRFFIKFNKGFSVKMKLFVLIYSKIGLQPLESRRLLCRIY